jgi:hypothetical protein
MCLLYNKTIYIAPDLLALVSPSPNPNIPKNTKIIKHGNLCKTYMHGGCLKDGAIVMNHAQKEELMR